MFDFRKLEEVVKDLGRLSLEGAGERVTRQFVEITVDTKLADLMKFFEWNAAAVVTERVGEELVPKAVVTKVDLLSWLVRQGKE